MLDFNKAINLPCAYIPYATCPLAPPQNRLSLAIEAGELKYEPQPRRTIGWRGQPVDRERTKKYRRANAIALEARSRADDRESKPPGTKGSRQRRAAESPGVVEEIEVRGHIVDSLLLPKILDRILLMGGTFEIRECKIGVHRTDPSYARIAIQADSHEALGGDPGRPGRARGLAAHPEDATIVAADIAGAFPDGFYSTTNQTTQVRVNGRWITVDDQEMDCGIVVDRDDGPGAVHSDVSGGRRHADRGRPCGGARAAGRAVARSQPVRVHELDGLEREAQVDQRAGAWSTRSGRPVPRGRRCLLVGGPAIVHTGSAGHVARLIQEGWIQVLFAGNALATHDIEQALYGTSLGVSLTHGEPIEHGHEHHLRAINTIRRLGGIARAVEAGVLTSGIMYECVKAGVDVVLAGSIRDDGPLPEVITDTLVAQDRMRQAIHGVGFALLIATALHSIATGNLLAGLGEGRLRRHQPGDRDQAERPRDVSDRSGW